MNKLIVFLCFIVVLSLHLIVFLNYKNKTIITSKTSEDKTLLLQLSKAKEIQKTAEISKNIEKEIKPKETKAKEKKKEEKKIKKIEKSKEKKRKKVEKNKEKKKNSLIQKQSKQTKQKIKKPENSFVEPLNKSNIKEENKKKKEDLKNIREDYMKSYASKLREEINKNKNYPRISKRLKEEGSVIVSFRVLKSGLFTNIKIIHSSKKKRLDKAALNALYLTKKYKAFDEELLNKDFIDFKLALEFSLY